MLTDKDFEKYRKAARKTEELCPPSPFDLPASVPGPVTFSRELDVSDLVAKDNEPKLKQNPFDVNKAFEEFFEPSIRQKVEPVAYVEEKKTNKVTDLDPDFLYGDILDDILTSFGGVEEVIRCKWDKNLNEGELVCLMKDWRVFRYVLKANDFAVLKPEDRVAKINRECHVFEDVDDWGHWEELGGKREEAFKKDMEAKKKEQDMLDYSETYSEALAKFFAGDLDAMTRFNARYGSKSV